MVRKRFIPCLLLRDGGLVKTERFKKYKYVGDPINAVKIFNDKEVDELIFLDIDASKQNRGPDLQLLNDLASECFMPFAYGGGISSLNQIEELLKIGIEKIIINQGGLVSETLIPEIVKSFGSSTVVGAIDVKKNMWGKHQVYDHVKDKTIAIEPITLAKKYCDLGVGEIFLNSVDLDGTFQGYDLKLVEAVSSNIPVPLIASGGASNTENLNAVIGHGASAAAAGSLFVFQGPHKAVLISYPIS
ncbi:AglZ/HisF2 family acetamidino modification protein [Pedobacter sp. MW01-1-1]|uniref:AglZ/HisF2 family acetamidino modification protein n=1 Tax=Pedobacter sp. MW01-1-1 TaxID=3383027 RepID=UPI003FF00CB1